MKRKLLVVLPVLTFALGSVSIFWPRPASANTGEELKVYHYAAEPWDDWDWNSVTSPSTPDSNSTYSPAHPARSGDKPQLRKAQQKPQKSFRPQFQSFLFNLRLLFGSK